MFQVGDILFTRENEHYHVIQILQVSEDYFIKDYWESASLDIQHLEIRSWAKRADFPSLNGYEFLKNEKITERDQNELHQFLEIEKGLNHRKGRTASMPSLVDEAMNKQDFLLALELLTEWAMLDKYRAEIYLKREECFRKLNRSAEADYERHVYNTLTGK